MFRRALLLTAAALPGLLPVLGVAQDEPGDASFPRPLSLKRGEVNVRSGPGTQYPVLWIYWRLGYPVVGLAEFDNYIKIRDLEGEEGWVHQVLLSRRPTALVANPGPARLLNRPDPAARAIARLAPGVVVALTKPCTETFCAVEVIPSGEEGYVVPSALEAPLSAVFHSAQD